jgi:ParB-like chromosome segregation protein Spo0J
MDDVNITPFLQTGASEPKTDGTLVLTYIAPDLRSLAVPVAELRPASRNARRHMLDRDIPVLVESLRRFGQLKPIVVRSSGEVIAGSGTLLATQQLKRSHIAAIRFDGNDVEALAFALTDNQTALLSSWDLEELGAQLSELRDLDVDLPVALGWSTDDLTTLLDADHFQPATEGEQGRLDRIEPITCPRCGHEFHS